MVPTRQSSGLLLRQPLLILPELRLIDFDPEADAGRHRDLAVDHEALDDAAQLDGPKNPSVLPRLIHNDPSQTMNAWKG